MAPTQKIPVITYEQDSRPLNELEWGFLPSWAKDPATIKKPANARSETVHEKKYFATAFKQRRCLVPVSGWYEWKPLPIGKQPMHIRLRSGRPFAMVALYEVWTGPGDLERTTFATLTCQPNDFLRRIHQRMPVIIPPAEYSLWLDPAVTEREALAHLLEPYPGAELEAYPVSRRVSRTRNDSPDLIEPAEPVEIPQSAKQLNLDD